MDAHHSACPFLPSSWPLMQMKMVHKAAMMTSSSNTGGRHGTVLCFMVLRSIVDNSF